MWRVEKGERPSRVGAIGGLIAAGAVVLGIGWAVEACDGGNNPPQAPTATATQTAGSPIPTATPEPTPSTGYSHEQGGDIVYTTEKGEALNVPQIEGLRAELQTTEGQQKVVYKALPENPYAMTAEQYAGEYKPNVEVRGVQTGGVVLKAPVVSKLTSDKLDTITNQTDKWIFSLPVDITTANTNDSISIQFTRNNSRGIQACEVSFDENLPVVNIIPASTGLDVLNAGQGSIWTGRYIDAWRLISDNNSNIIPGEEMKYLSVAGDLHFSQEGTISSGFGDQVSTQLPLEGRKKVVVYLAAFNEWRDADETKILDAGDSKTPVFVAVNTP